MRGPRSGCEGKKADKVDKKNGPMRKNQKRKNKKGEGKKTKRPLICRGWGAQGKRQKRSKKD